MARTQFRLCLVDRAALGLTTDRYGPKSKTICFAVASWISPEIHPFDAA